MYLDHFQIFIIYGENMGGKKKKKSLLHDFQIWTIYGNKHGKKMKQINKLLYHFQILAIYGENMEGKCNIIIFVTSFQTCIWYKSEPVPFCTHSPHVINNAIGLSGRNVIMISPSISPNSLKYMRTHSFFHHTFIQS